MGKGHTCGQKLVNSELFDTLTISPRNIEGPGSCGVSSESIASARHAWVRGETHLTFGTFDVEGYR